LEPTEVKKGRTTRTLVRKKSTRNLENTFIPIAVWFVTQSGYQSSDMSEVTLTSSHHLFCFSMASFYIMIPYSYCRFLETFLALPLDTLIEASRGLWNSGHISNLR